MTRRAQSAVWPALPGDPLAASLLTHDEMIDSGGAACLRAYLAERLAAIAAVQPATPGTWAGVAIAHLKDRAGNRTGHCDPVEVRASALQTALAYVEYLEAAVAAREAA